MSSNNLWLPDLLSSDSGYFKAGATTVSFEGCGISVLFGFESLSSGCVAHTISKSRLPDDLIGWISALEHRFSELGSSLVRLYLQESIPELEAVLAQRGYDSANEIAVVLDAADNESFETDAWLKPIENEDDWNTKMQVHRAMEICPDGHIAPPDLWVEMERTKCLAGYMKPYLIMNGDTVAGEVNVAPWGRVLRIKNLAVIPGERLQNMACDSIKLIAAMTKKHGREGCGAFVFEGAPAVQVYEKAGFQDLGHQQTEWFKSLDEHKIN